MTFLFIDNDAEDLELYQEAIEEINTTVSPSAGKKINSIMLSDCQDIERYLVSLAVIPDIIFLDINMPVVSGIECLKLLKVNPQTATIPVVMLSTNCPRADTARLKKMGAVDCIRKPNDYRALVKIFSTLRFSTL